VSANQLALAILRAREQLPRSLAQLVTPAVAWTLAVLLISWRPKGLAGEVDLTRFPAVTGALDRFGDALLRFREDALAAKSALDLAGASGVFVATVNQIGADLLSYLVRSEIFQKLQAYIQSVRPIPAEVLNAASGVTVLESPSRLDRYRAFDNRPRSASQPAQPDAPTSAQLSHWRAQLGRDDLSPEMRWFYEQKIETSGEPIYTDLNEAERRWLAVLGKNQLNPELRAYFAANLEQLQRVRVQA
jgi:hypothetical protein